MDNSLTAPEGEVKSRDEVVCFLSSFRHDVTCKHWWRVKASGVVLFGKFDVRPSEDVKFETAIFASRSPTRAAEVIGDRITSTEWVDPMKPPFRAPPNFPTVDRAELEHVKRLTHDVEVVQYKGTQYVHKFMGYPSQPSSYETEIKHHQLVSGSRFLPQLFNVVTHEGQNRGLLLEFIDGENLCDLATSLNHSQLYRITASILEALEDFESRGYYPQDLKGANMVWRESDRTVFIVDLGEGFTDRMHMKKAWHTSAMEGSILPRHMLYTLGRTLWELWIDDVPPLDELEEAPATLPALVRELIDECCTGTQFKTVAEVKAAFFDKLLELHSTFPETSLNHGMDT
jgi:hypothetical protein